MIKFLNLFSEEQDVLKHNQYKLLLPCPTGTKKQIYHAKISHLNIRHICNNNCQGFIQFRSSSLIIEHKKMIEFDNLNQRVANLYYRQRKKRKISFTIGGMDLKIMKYGYEYQNARKKQQQLITDIVMNLYNLGYNKKIIANEIRRPLSRINYIIRNEEQAKKNNLIFIWLPIYSDWIYNILTTQNVKYCFNLQNILHKFNQQFFMNIKLKKFSQLLKQNMRITFKYPTSIKRGSQSQNINQLRFHFSIRLANFITQGFDVVYLDETYIGRGIKRVRLWQLREKPINLMDFTPDSPLSILGAISTKGFLAYQLVIGSVNGIVYAQHIQQIIEEYKTTNDITKAVFILDNATIHKTKASRKQVLDQVEYLFLPPYTPQYNPIEIFWGLIKRQLYKEMSFKDKKDFLKILHEIFSGYSFKDIQNICQKNYQYLKKGYLQQQF